MISIEFYTQLTNTYGKLNHYISKIFERRGNISIDHLPIKSHKLKLGTLLYHVSETKYDFLKSSFKSRDEFLYSENRIYFTTDIESLEPHFKKYRYVYMYVVTGNENTFIDYEYNNNKSFYISNDKPFEIKEVQLL